MIFSDIVALIIVYAYVAVIFVVAEKVLKTKILKRYQKGIKT